MLANSFHSFLAETGMERIKHVYFYLNKKKNNSNILLHSS